MAKKRYIRGWKEYLDIRKKAGFDFPKYDEKEKGDCMVRAFARYLKVDYKEMWDICAGLNWNAGEEATGDNRVKNWQELAEHFGLFQIPDDPEGDKPRVIDYYQFLDSFIYKWMDTHRRRQHHWVAIIDGIIYDYKPKGTEFWQKHQYAEDRSPDIVLVSKEGLTKYEEHKYNKSK